MTEETRLALKRLNNDWQYFMIGLCAVIFLAGVAGAAAVSLYQQHGPSISCRILQ